MNIPVIDLNRPNLECALEMAKACREHGFFCIKNHDFPLGLQLKMLSLSRRFFELPIEEKNKIHMRNGGLAWRGFFSVGEELTSGIADLKEGLYFGEQLSINDPRVKNNWPLHGLNQYPEISHFKETTTSYMAHMNELAHRLMRLISLSLGLNEDFIFTNYTKNPTSLFRIFHYPPQPINTQAWGVGEHTDYGLLTILQQDNCGGLQVKSNNNWVDVSPSEDVFVCNIGDMLELLTKGHYKSTPHRVNNTSGRERFSFPFFFDPGFETKITPLPLPDIHVDTVRWDEKNLHKFNGLYRDYILSKVSQVFPELSKTLPTNRN
jgi:isopenicillin N synthase-like dioxygenase